MKNKKKLIITKNYLELSPRRKCDIKWNADEEGNITLEVENRGWVNRIAQLIFSRPKISYIHLDKMGNFIWPKLDGKINIIELGELIKAEFGDEAEPLYERLAKYIKILESYNFIEY